MPTALIISSIFPPSNSAGGSIRLVKFIKYLSARGWTFVVYTQDVPNTFSRNQTLSDFLLEELPNEASIIRVADPFVLGSPKGSHGWITRIVRRIFGESSVGWGINALRSGFANLQHCDFDLVFSVTPPFTNALVALLLAWMGQKPLVLDLKDDWVDSPTFRHKNVFRQIIERWLEKLIVSRAAAVIAVTPQSFHLYRTRYADLHLQSKFHLIPNGCDVGEYKRLKNRERKILTERFLILSAASGFRKNYRDIAPFLFALDLFLQRRLDAKDKIDVVLLGDSLSAEYDELLSTLDLNNIVRCIGALGRDDLVEQLWKADLFLLVQPVKNTTAISGTLYEYWATGKAPILLISEEGASSVLVEENRLGRHFHFHEVGPIADYLEEIFDSYVRQQPLWIERVGIEKFDRRRLAKRMDAIWREILARNV